MGIPISEYIGISTKVVDAGITNVNMSALVFTKANMKAGATGDIKTKYDNHEVVTLSRDEISTYFDATSPVAKFADKYFGWSGGTANPAVINLCKVSSTEYPKVALENALKYFTDFGTYTFLGTYGTSKDFEYSRVFAAAQAQENAGYRLAVPCSTDDYEDVCETFNGLANTFVVECSDIGTTGQADADVNYGAYTYCAWFASVNYDSANASDSIDFKSFPGLDATVDSASGKSDHDLVKCNYIGEVQSRGLNRKFMQNGVLMNGVDAGVDRDAVWIQTLIEIGFLDLATRTKIPANGVGAAMVKNIVVDVANRGIDAGAILVNKSFSNEVRTEINQYANNDSAADVVESTGYYIATRIIPFTVGDVTRYKVQYTLIYGKGDHISKVDGTHILV